MSYETSTLNNKGQGPDKTKVQRGKGTDNTDETGPVVRFVLSCRTEAKLAKWNNVQQTRMNWDIYWLRQDFGHKMEGQSREVLSMQPMAVETTSSFLMQSLADMGDEWYSVDVTNPQNEPFLKIDPATIKSILSTQLKKVNILQHITHGAKSGLLGGNVIAKVHGDFYDVPKFIAEREVSESGVKLRKAKLKQVQQKAWKSRIDVVSQFNYYPDPTPNKHKKLYEIEDMWIDYHQVVEMSKGEDAIYDYDTVCKIEHNMPDDAEAKFDELRRTNQNMASANYRGRVKITEFWGTLLDENDEVSDV